MLLFAVICFIFKTAGNKSKDRGGVPSKHGSQVIAGGQLTHEALLSFHQSVPKIPNNEDFAN